MTHFSHARSPVARFVLVATLVATGASQMGCGASRPAGGSPTSGGYGGGYATGPKPPSPAYAGGGESGSGSGGGGYAAESTGAPSADDGSASGTVVSGAASPGGVYAPSPAPMPMPMPMPAPKTATAPPPPPPATAMPKSADKKGKDAPPAAGTTATGTVTVTTTVTVNPPVIPPPAYPDDQGSPTGGLLTAAIWDDVIMRPQFQTFIARYPAFSEMWGLDLSKKITIVVNDSNGIPVGDAPIALRAPDGQTIQLRTHGDGTALFFPTMKMQVPQTNANGQGTTLYSVAAQVGTLRTETAFGIPQGDLTWSLKLPGVPVRAQAPALDVAIVLDTTGSMGDEITYLQNELTGVMKRVQKEQATRRVRLGLVLYKDRGDDYVTKSFPFTEDFAVFNAQIKQASAMGGGDMPESVNAALTDTINNLAWAGDETGRLAILVADAPPHYYADEQYTYKNAVWDFSARGIKLVTLGASGIDKSTEYVFREMSAFTGGRYIFLTDDSGIGESHLVPDITGYQVEHLDKILVRVIRDEAKSFVR